MFRRNFGKFEPICKILPP